MANEDIWWQENAAGNELTNPNMAKGVARMFMDALEAKYPQLVFYLILFCFVFTPGQYCKVDSIMLVMVNKASTTNSPFALAQSGYEIFKLFVTLR